MSLKRALLLIASFGLSVVLIALLIRVAKVDIWATLRQLKSVSWAAFFELVLLNCLLNLISTEKWRSIDVTLRHSTDSIPSRTASFTLTSAGLALGIFLPVQFAVATARTLGTYVHGGALKRGTAGTLYEQSFDMAAACLLGFASGFTWFYRGGALLWTISAIVMMLLGLGLVGPSVRLIQRLAAKNRMAAKAPQTRVGTMLQSFSDLLHSGLLDAGLARRLFGLSAARFAVIVFMSIQTAKAVGASIPLWSMAAAIPFVILASALALTPGALGISEFTSTSALSLFGIPLAVGAQWALANRVLVAISYFAVATCSAILLCVRTLMDTRRASGVQERWRCS